MFFSSNGSLGLIALEVASRLPYFYIPKGNLICEEGRVEAVASIGLSGVLSGVGNAKRSICHTTIPIYLLLYIY